MSAQPIEYEDPQDPQVILRVLPEAQRPVFLAQYRDAVLAAAEPAGYKELTRVLKGWAHIAWTFTQPGYRESVDADVAAFKAGTLRSVPFDEAIAAELYHRE
jgi:hypothetical protein